MNWSALSPSKGVFNDDRGSRGLMFRWSFIIVRDCEYFGGRFFVIRDCENFYAGSRLGMEVVTGVLFVNIRLFSGN